MEQRSRIAVIGGGISGLYMANKLSRTHEVTIFEADKWGGDVQHVNVDGECYPVSTIAVMPGDNELRRELLLRRIKPSAVDMLPFNRPLILFLIVAVLPVAAGCVIFAKGVFTRIMAAIILILAIYMLNRSINKSIGDLLLALGADNAPRSNHTGQSIRNYVGNIRYVFESFKILSECGFSKLVQSYLTNPDITYVNERVKRLDRNATSATVHTGHHVSQFDKVVIACPFLSYMSFMPLDEAEKQVLSQNTYFDFYSTLLMLDGEVSSEQLHEIAHQGIFKFKDGVYLLASHIPLTNLPAHVKYKKEFKWKMLIKSKQIQTLKRATNEKKDRTVLFVGKEMATSNGVNSCMRYCGHVLETHFGLTRA